MGQKSFITSIPALLRDGEVDVGLVVHGEGGVTGRNVAAVGRLVSAEDVQEEREQARPSRRKQYLVLFKEYFLSDLVVGMFSFTELSLWQIFSLYGVSYFGGSIN